MNAVSTPLSDARRTLRAGGSDTSALELLSGTLPRLVAGQLPEALAQFHNIAGRLPFAGDSDFGALLLESLADGSDDSALAREFLVSASYRARWCVQAATSGGEGLARAADLNRIQSKLDSLK
ncbi:MAG: hypothetical protein J0M24_03710 [Verrucomicrobia bacterium]|nr:hypothetical protein [Verrucomicrobiota bacterium]